MRFPEKRVSLKNGRTAVLRPTRPDDAAEMIEYMKATAGETEFILRYPDEVHYTIEAEQEILGRILDDPSSAMMAAEVDGKIAGNSSISGLGGKRKLRHRCSLAITLYQEYWNLGIGSAMIREMIVLAREIGYTQIDLEVVADNERAIRVYEKCGFIATGRRHHALKFDDGSLHDEILMYHPL